MKISTKAKPTTRKTIATRIRTTKKIAATATTAKLKHFVNRKTLETMKITTKAAITLEITKTTTKAAAETTIEAATKTQTITTIQV